MLLTSTNISKEQATLEFILKYVTDRFGFGFTNQLTANKEPSQLQLLAPFN